MLSTKSVPIYEKINKCFAITIINNCLRMTDNAFDCHSVVTEHCKPQTNRLANEWLKPCDIYI